MPIHPIRSTIIAGLILVATGSTAPCQSAGTRATALERYGLGGHIQAIGVHHGFHIETVAIDSAASEDQLRAHDVIVKVDGDVIRNLDHLRAVLAEAYLDDGEVTLTYLRGTSLAHHVLKCQLGRPVKAVSHKRRVDDEGDSPR